MLRYPALWCSLALTAPALAQTCDVRLQSNDLDGGDKFGTAVALDGVLAFSGAPEVRPAGTSDRLGAVYVHAKDPGTGSWNEVAKIVPPGLVHEDRFGSSIALSGQTFVAGAPNRNNVLATDLGQAFVYSHAGMGVSWTMEAELAASDGALTDEFGTAVGIAGDFVIVGAPQHDGAVNNAGAA